MKRIPRNIGAIEDYYAFDRKKDLLGHGSFGRVFRVTRIRDGQIFALKESFSSDPEIFNDALEEFDIMSFLSKKGSKDGCTVGIVCYEDVFVARSVANQGQEKVYLLMQYIRGCDMLRLINAYGKGLDDESLLKFMQAIMRTVSFIHSKNIVQGSLKLKHILFTEEAFYLVDFKYVHFDLDIDDALADDIKTIGESFMQLYLGPGKHDREELPSTFLGRIIMSMTRDEADARPTAEDVLEMLALDLA